ncbi:MAG TPA: PP2C family protein-serine/threonine phosphatase [Thermoanaerobaculia bacterium]|nr:PP2C family protein-serine/threonine phosphatase [Thermoanaerobaculia bacterium]
MDIVHANGAVPLSRHDIQPASPVLKSPGIGPAYAVRAISRPATEFTGDFYLTMQLDEVLWFGLGDFAGHGLASAIHMAMVQEELERIIPSCPSIDPVEVIAALDLSMREVLPFNRFATLVIGRAFKNGSVDIVNAGHSHPMLLRDTGTLELIRSHGPVIGLVPGARWQHETIRLGRGDRLVLYTDGIGEAAARCCLDEFGRERLANAIQRADPANPLDSILSEVDVFTEGTRHDDQTLLILTRQ